FMNMLRNEENAKYRQLIKSTLTFDPEILKRYVNFMNNPDEKTAVEQFGKGDKYFGICTLLATMPGLPMFGHGQIEGYSEKYGMEYYRPYWDEQPDLGFVDAHRYNIFPILHRRKLFAEVADFRLYDFKANEHEVDENVFAYSNALGNIAALVIYNNRFGNASGWIKTSAPYLVKQGNEGNLHTQNLAQALRLPNIREGFLVMRDQVSRKFYLRSMSEVHDKGLFFDLNAYERMVLSDFHIVHGEQYAQLHAHLQGRPVDNIDATLEDLQMQPLLRELEGMLHNVANISHSQSQDERKTFLNYAINNWRELSQKTRLLNIECRSDLEQSLKELEALGETVLRFMDHEEEVVTQTHDLQKFTEKLEEKPHALIYLLSHAFISRLCGSVFNPANVHKTLSLLSKEQIRARVCEHYRAIGLPIDKIHEYFVNSRWLTACLHTMTFDELSQPNTFFEKNLANPDFRQALVINHHEGVEWFNKEAFETMLWNLKMIPSMEILADKTSEEEKAQCLLKLNAFIASFRKAERKSGYRVDFFFNALSSD
ncbi:MAG TPA: hypothetical protein PLU23_05010, partial [Anaerolineaceae bacterium]|nr:hypothetical protein [Anaerolineaceae bacterium]